MLVNYNYVQSTEVGLCAVQSGKGDGGEKIFIVQL